MKMPPSGKLSNQQIEDLRRWVDARACTYDTCPCTVPANRGMIE